MLSKSLRHGLLALSILGFCLAPASAQAATRAGKPAPRVVSAAPQLSFAQVVWRGIVHLLAKEGAGIDPSGRPTTSSLSGTGDEGAGIDPSGLHHG
jgi:hypothetical protein